MSCPSIIFEVVRDLISGRFGTGLLVGGLAGMSYHLVAGACGDRHLLITGAFLATLSAAHRN